MSSLRDFLISYWDTDVRYYGTSSEARDGMRQRGVEAEVRRFLTAAILFDSVTPEVWSSLFNVQTYTPAEVRADATEFWTWLYEGEDPPAAT